VALSSISRAAQAKCVRSNKGIRDNSVGITKKLDKTDGAKGKNGNASGCDDVVQGVRWGSWPEQMLVPTNQCQCFFAGATWLSFPPHTAVAAEMTNNGDTTGKRTRLTQHPSPSLR
jgi:hypothetical protein